MNLLPWNPISSFSRWMWPNEEESFPAKKTKATLQFSDDEAQVKQRKCSISRVLSKSWNTLIQTINTVVLFKNGFNLHTMHAWAKPQKSFVAKHGFLPFLKIPTFNFATHLSTAREINRHHREDQKGFFTIDKGKLAIHNLIADMLEDPTITNEDIVFTCSPQNTSRYNVVLHAYFRSNKIEERLPQMHECVLDTLKRWRELSQQEGRVNITKESLSFTCDMMSRLFLGHTDKNQELTSAFRTFFEYIVLRFQNKPVEMESIRKAKKILWQVVDEAIVKKVGLAGELLKSEQFEKKEIRMIIFSIFFAGMDSSSSSLMYTLLKCAQDPQLQQSIRKEISEKSDDEEPIHSLAYRLDLIKQIMVEGLRMFPPVIGVTRIARKDLTLKIKHNDSTVERTIPKGELIAPSPSILARCPALFPNNPNKFDPKRHKEKVPKNLTSLPWMPFGGGKHTCTGWAHYQAQVLILFTEMFPRFKLETKIKGEPEQTGHFINKLKTPVFITFEELN